MEVYREMGSQLYGTALRILKRPEEAEDVVQECFVRLFEKARTIESDNLGGWLHRVAVNLCLDRLKAKSNQTVELPEDLGAKRPRVDESSRLDLFRAVSSLPEQARLESSYGQILSDFPTSLEEKGYRKSAEGQVGSGRADASVSLSARNGSVRLKQQ